VPRGAKVTRVLKKPKLVAALAKRPRSSGDPARRVSCGAKFTCVLTASGRLFSFGEGRCGELGIGRLVSEVDAPTLVGTGFSDVACGWSHCVALHDGRPHAWGLNAFGQLGLFDEDTEKEEDPLKCATSPRPLRLRGATSVEAQGHSSSAICDGGRLAGWGRLYRSRRPRLLLQGKRVTQVAGPLAFAPFRVVELRPTAVPRSGAKLRVSGSGFFDSGQVKVKLTTTAAFSEVVVDGVFVVGQSEVLCDTPALPSIGHYAVAVSFNGGHDFTAAGDVFLRVYEDVVLSRLVRPLGCPFRRGGPEQRLEVLGHHIQKDTDTYTIRLNDDHVLQAEVLFEEKEEKPWGGGDDDDDREDPSPDVEEGSRGGDVAVGLWCSLPLDTLDVRSPTLYCVSASANGQDYSTAAPEPLIVHAAEAFAVTPPCAPLREGGLPPVQITGRSFFDRGQLLQTTQHDLESCLVRLEYDGGVFYETRAKVLDEATIEFTPPTSLPTTVLGIKGPLAAAGAAQEKRKKSFDEKNSFDDHHGPPPTKEEVLRCTLRLSVDGRFLEINNGKNELAFTLYNEGPLTATLASPTLGPLAGNTTCHLALPEAYLLDDHTCCLVRLRDDEGRLRATARANLLKNKGALVFSTPALGDDAFLVRRSPEPPKAPSEEEPGSAAPRTVGRRVRVSIDLALDGRHFVTLPQHFDYFEPPTFLGFSEATLAQSATQSERKATLAVGQSELGLVGERFPEDAGAVLVRLSTFAAAGEEVRGEALADLLSSEDDEEEKEHDTTSSEDQRRQPGGDTAGEGDKSNKSNNTTKQRIVQGTLDDDAIVFAIPDDLETTLFPPLPPQPEKNKPPVIPDDNDNPDVADPPKKEEPPSKKGKAKKKKDRDDDDDDDDDDDLIPDVFVDVAIDVSFNAGVDFSSTDLTFAAPDLRAKRLALLHAATT